MRIYMRYPNGLSKALTLSYDDGVVQDIRLIEIMSKYGIKGTFNINAGIVAKEDNIGKTGRLSEKQIAKLYAESGNEVAVHGYLHPHLEELSMPMVTNEVLKDRVEIERITGKITRGMAYPFGTWNNEVVECLKACGIAYARTVKQTENFVIPKDWLRLDSTCHHNNPRLFELTERFVEGQPRTVDSCWLFYLWGHSYEFDNDNNWERIEEFASKIGKKDDIWYATNIEIYDYVKAYKQLLFNAEGTLVHNPTATDVWILKEGNLIKVCANTVMGI